MNTEIYYFTGSGNSLQIAKELAARLEDAVLLPIVSLLEKEEIVINTDTAGIVFPLHGMTLPVPVRKFLKKADVSQTKYLFSVANRAGTKCFAHAAADKILSAKGRKLDAFFTINAFNNDPKFKDFRNPSDEKFAQWKSGIVEKADEIVQVVGGRKTHREKDMEYLYPSGWLLERLVIAGMAFAGKTGCKDYYYADAKCTGCGACSKVCPSGKVKMIGGKPVWQDSVKCYLCYGCLNYCPAGAVQIKDKPYMKSYTQKTGRYAHPFASAKDMEEQKLIVEEKKL